MARARASAPAPMRSPHGHAPTTRGREGYARLSMRPLHVLIFLLPMIVLYELGSARYLSDPGHGIFETIGARKVLTDFFKMFGVAGYILPPVVLLSVLLTWHVLERGRWKIQLSVLLGMLLESVLWMLPILVFGQIVGGRPSMVMVPMGELAQHTWQAKVT